MGVIKKHENLFEIKCSVSEETLYIPSSDEEEANLSQNIENQLHKRSKNARQQPPTIGSTFSILKKGSGKKKFRRYHDAIQLITMAEEDELQEVTIEDFIVNSKCGFSVLLKDEQSLQQWNEFISSSEEQQKIWLQSKNSKKIFEDSKPLINKSLRALLKKKSFPIGILHYLEQELISFFCNNPKKIYISPILSSFERLLLHLLSNYHHLISLSFLSKPENVKLVRVKNPKKEFSLQPFLLAQYLESKYGTERTSENMHIIANEPSLAFYRLQEHIRKVMPGMVQKRVEVVALHQDLQGCCYDMEYALSAIKFMDNAKKNFMNTQELLKNALFLCQQLKYEENRKFKKDSTSTFKRLSAHITLDLPDLPDAFRETASKVEYIMTQARHSSNI